MTAIRAGWSSAPLPLIPVIVFASLRASLLRGLRSCLRGVQYGSEAARWCVPAGRLMCVRRVLWCRDYSPRIFDRFRVARSWRVTRWLRWRVFPHLAFEHARRALAPWSCAGAGGVAVIFPSFSCERCRMPARCGSVVGLCRWLRVRRFPSCSWCGHLALAHWRCSSAVYALALFGGGCDSYC